MGKRILTEKQKERSRIRVRERRAAATPEELEKRRKKNREYKRTITLKNTVYKDLSDSDRNAIITKKRESTNLEKYGVTNQANREEIKVKKAITNLALYGHENASSSPAIKEKRRATVRDRYGVDYTLESKDVRSSIKATNLERYGAESPLQSKVILEKIKKSNLEKYGTTNPASLFTKDMLAIGDNTPLKVYCRLEGKAQAYERAKVLYHESSPEVAKDYIDNYGDGGASSLEKVTERLLNIPILNRKVVDGYRADFKINAVTYLESDGLYWHCSKHKKNKYHLLKRLAYEKMGLRLFQFRSNEIRDTPEIIKSMVSYAQGNLKRKLFARKLSISKVETIAADEFFKRTHLMGKSPSAKYYGLLDDNKSVVALMGVREFKGHIEISRFSCELYTSVVGGFGKLVKHIQSVYGKDIVSFCDLRYATGTSYIAIGFKVVGVHLGFEWTDLKNVYNRRHCKAVEGKKEREVAEDKKLYKIFNAGQSKFILPYTSKS